jgi:Tfp pilus assembly protein PilN
MIRLNLLPPNIKEDIDYAKKNAAIYQLLVKFVAGFIIMATTVGVVGYIVYSNKMIAEEEKAVTKAQLESWTNTERDALDFANRLNLVDKIDGEKINWDHVFAEIASSTPANVRLVSYDFTNNAKERVGLTGLAATNTDISTFRELLSKSSLFQYVDIESIVAATNPTDSSRKAASFKITMNLNLVEAKK